MTTNERVTIITSERRAFPDLGEAWRYRHLAWLLAVRNIKVRYAQTLMGTGWVFVQPLLLAGVVSVVIGVVLKAPSDGVPYAAFSMAGLSLWTFFSRMVMDASTSITANSGIIGKVFFPRILAPASSALTGILDFLPVLFSSILIIALVGEFPGFKLAFAPFIALFLCLMGLACGIWISVFDALIRDLRLLIPSLLQLVLYVSPILYSSSAVPEKWRGLYYLNPLVGVFELYRWSMIAHAPAPPLFSLAVSGATVIVLLVSGLWVFARLEGDAVDRM